MSWRSVRCLGQMAPVHGDKGKEVVEVINDLFAWEVEKGGEVCTVKTSNSLICGGFGGSAIW
jgi:hypothetical protein